MARLDPGASVRWLSRRAKQAASSLKAEYEAGTRGDDSPTEPIFPTPGEQLAAITALLAGTRRADRAGQPAPDDDATSAADDAAETPTSPAGPAGPSDPTPAPAEHGHAADDADAEEVAAALHRVDWQQVRSVTAERTGAASDAMRAMAREVDWAKVQPVAAQVSSALIAAVASGRLPIAGRMGPLVAKALRDNGALAQRVGASLTRADAPLPPDFRAELQPAGDPLPGDGAGARPPDRASSGVRPVAPLPRWSEER